MVSAYRQHPRHWDKRTRLGLAFALLVIMAGTGMRLFGFVQPERGPAPSCHDRVWALLIGSERSLARECGAASAPAALAVRLDRQLDLAALEIQLERDTLASSVILGESLSGGQAMSAAPSAAPEQVIRDESTRKIDQAQIEAWVHELAPEYDLDPKLVLEVIAVESKFDPEAESHKRAQGLMQLMPATAARFGVEDVADPRQNLRGGMAYLRWLLVRFDGDLRLALAGYNAGEGAVKRFEGIPPYRETQRYVERITRAYGKVEHPVPPA